MEQKENLLYTFLHKHVDLEISVQNTSEHFI